MGGGLGVRYQNEEPPTIDAYIKAIYNTLANRSIEIILEPGRSLIAEAGILVTQVDYIKYADNKNFAIVDAAMNDLIRPALYQSWQSIIPAVKDKPIPAKNYDIVGPVCESSDFLGKNRKLSIEEGDLLAIETVGAYGFSMSSNYNSRPRPAEIMVAGEHISLIRKRESINDLMLHELIDSF